MEGRAGYFSYKSAFCRRKKESQPLTETSANQAEALLSALSSLEIGSLYYDKYVVDQGQRRGINSIIAYARCKDEPTREVKMPAPWKTLVIAWQKSSCKIEQLLRPSLKAAEATRTPLRALSWTDYHDMGSF